MSNAKTLARRCAVQAIYQWQLSDADLSSIEAQFLTELKEAKILLRRYKSGYTLTDQEQSLLEESLEKYCRQRETEEEQPQTLDNLIEQCCAPDINARHFKELLHGVPQHLHAIDAAVSEFADRPVAEIDPVERAILRISVYELLYRLEIPYRVVLNEGIDLAKHFGAAESHKYINGILDRVARKHRMAEIEAQHKA
ncbi:transcription antitermination factor NusB [Methylocaldum szegediense]|uniref:Transcription antitermination protein NusB n=1 Tax=Methylocaldum szegediense TaxID=73780 RepID=A0ABM9HYA9_9GAMM|nr:transcription antitermination factor NusB [Methylocaldum szegediense]CAI8766925.1 Transcription antitermination protein NusB [Methylocaldum szegediense]